jgi:hypothetical protein
MRGESIVLALCGTAAMVVTAPSMGLFAMLWLATAAVLIGASTIGRESK